MQSNPPCQQPYDVLQMMSQPIVFSYCVSTEVSGLGSVSRAIVWWHLWRSANISTGKFQRVEFWDLRQKHQKPNNPTELKPMEASIPGIFRGDLGHQLLGKTRVKQVGRIPSRMEARKETSLPRANKCPITQFSDKPIIGSRETDRRKGKAPTRRRGSAVGTITGYGGTLDLATSSQPRTVDRFSSHAFLLALELDAHFKPLLST